MKLMEFKYTKADGNVSERAVVVTQEPQKLLGGIDVTNMDADRFAEFTKRYREVSDRNKQNMQELMAEFDLTHNYRQFKLEGMSDVKQEWV